MRISSEASGNIPHPISLYNSYGFVFVADKFKGFTTQRTPDVNLVKGGTTPCRYTMAPRAVHMARAPDHRSAGADRNCGPVVMARLMRPQERGINYISTVL